MHITTRSKPLVWVTALTLLVTGSLQARAYADTTKATPIHGHAEGGQQPLAGAIIQLYAASTAGYGTTASPLLVTPFPS